MKRRISYFGGETRGIITVEHETSDQMEMAREIWFDQDTNGRWLVWAQEIGDASANSTHEMPVGAIVVSNPDVSAFLEQLGNLLADPSEFIHEPVFYGADDKSRTGTTEDS